MNYHTDRQFTAAQDLFAFLLESQAFQPRHIFDATARGASGWIFRGQSRHSWKLLPSAFRLGDPLARFTPQTAGEGAPTEGLRSILLGSQIHAELRAVHLFLEQADKLGIPTPLDYSSITAHQELLNAAMNRREPIPDEPFPDPRVLPGIALAQHHGVPTRLLDWTESPLVALYFAAVGNSASVSGHDVAPDTELAVYALDTDRFRDSTEVEMVDAPRYINTFLRSQKGIFTLTPRANQYYLREGAWPSLEDVIGGARELDHSLMRLTAPAAIADDVLRLLYRYDVTRHDLMPSLGNAALAFQYRRALWSSDD